MTPVCATTDPGDSGAAAGPQRGSLGIQVRTGKRVMECEVTLPAARVLEALS